jgi:Tol biopolymer transport system component
MGRSGRRNPRARSSHRRAPICLPQFSPDGKWIAFASSRSGNQEIWLSKRDGSQPSQLTSFGDKPSGTPRWSPDGRWIAFDSTHGGPGIYVISATGGVPRRITKRGRIPSWSRDGRWIYFVGRQVMKVAVTPPFTAQPDHPVPVTPEGANAAFESMDGKSLYYSLRGSIWKMPTGGGEGQQVVSQISGWSDFAVVDQGIFSSPGPTPARSSRSGSTGSRPEKWVRSPASRNRCSSASRPLPTAAQSYILRLIETRAI